MDYFLQLSKKYKQTEGEDHTLYILTPTKYGLRRAKKPNIPLTFTTALSLHLLKDIPDITDYRNIKPENISLLDKRKGLLSANVSSPLPQNVQLLKSLRHLLNS